MAQSQAQGGNNEASNYLDHRGHVSSPFDSAGVQHTDSDTGNGSKIGGENDTQQTMAQNGSRLDGGNFGRSADSDPVRDNPAADRETSDEDLVTNGKDSNPGRDSVSRDPAVLATTKEAINEKTEQGALGAGNPGGDGANRRNRGDGQPGSAGVVGGEDAIGDDLTVDGEDDDSVWNKLQSDFQKWIEKEEAPPPSSDLPHTITDELPDTDVDVINKGDNLPNIGVEENNNLTDTNVEKRRGRKKLDERRPRSEVWIDSVISGHGRTYRARWDEWDGVELCRKTRCAVIRWVRDIDIAVMEAKGESAIKAIKESYEKERV